MLLDHSGGLEDTVNEETGEIERLYRLGDECLGRLVNQCHYHLSHRFPRLST